MGDFSAGAPFMLERAVADLQHRSDRQRGNFGHPFAVNERPVGRFEVRHIEFVIHQRDHAVRAGDFRIGQDQVGRSGATDLETQRPHDAAFFNLVANRQFETMQTVARDEIHFSCAGDDLRLFMFGQIGGS